MIQIGLNNEIHKSIAALLSSTAQVRLYIPSDDGANMWGAFDAWNGLDQWKESWAVPLL